MRTIAIVVVTAFFTAVFTSAFWAISSRSSAPGRYVITLGLPSGAGRIGEIPDALRAKKLTIPVSDVESEALQPHFYDWRGDHGHEAIDIMAPLGQPVVATDDGVIARLMTSERGGITIYQFDPAKTFGYYYAHLDRYAAGLAEGDKVSRGQVIGYVGFTGNASESAPHLHFAIFRLGPKKQWWKGEALDPYPALTGK